MASQSTLAAPKYLLYSWDQQERAVRRALGTDGSPASSVLVKGGAGSQKTETLLKIGIQYALLGKRVIFVTLIGSVTSEIMQRVLQQVPGITFRKRGNHYEAMCGDASLTFGALEVANADAALDWRLRQAEVDLSDMGDQHDEKARIIADSELKGVYLRDKTVADVLLWDELQDAHHLRVKAFVQLLTGTHALVFAATDLIQTIFTHAIDGELHPVHYFARELACAIMPQTVCWRCPASHIMFRNIVMRQYDEQHGCEQLLVSPKLPEGFKPIVFAHGALSESNSMANCNASDLAEKAFRIICLLLEREPGLRRPKNIMITMPRCNGNVVFHQLEERLTKHFGPDSALIFTTKVEGARNRLNLEKASKTDAVCMLSIHADKGLGHDVHFLLGITEKSLPNEIRLFHPTELVDQSLLNVGLTRSKRYLFIGMAQGSPSRYIKQAMPELLASKCVTAVWDCSTWEEGMPTELCNILAAGPTGKRPAFDSPYYLQKPVFRPSKLVLNLSEDIAEVVPHPSGLLRFRWSTPKETTFGKDRWQVPENVSKREDLLMPVVGYMGECLLKRVLRDPTQHAAEYALELTVLNRAKVRFTADGRELDMVADLRLNGATSTQWTEKLRQHQINLLKTKADIRWLNVAERLLTNGPALILDAAFSGEDFRQSLGRFLQATDVRSLNGRDLWNVGLLYTARNGFRRAHLLSFIDYFSGDISGLVDNVLAFARRPEITSQCFRFQEPLNLLYRESKVHVLEKMGLKGSAQVGLAGIADGVGCTELLEVKTSLRHDCPNDWKLQAFGGLCLSRGLRTMRVVNLAYGRMFAWTLPETFHEKDKPSAIEKLFTAAGFSQEHVRELVEMSRRG